MVSPCRFVHLPAPRRYCKRMPASGHLQSVYLIRYIVNISYDDEAFNARRTTRLHCPETQSRRGIVASRRVISSSACSTICVLPPRYGSSRGSTSVRASRAGVARWRTMPLLGRKNDLFLTLQTRTAAAGPHESGQALHGRTPRHFLADLGRMCYAIGHISGCHINPAVTFGLTAGGRFPWKEVIPCVIAQVIGGLIAGAVLYLLATGKAGFDAAARRLRSLGGNAETNRCRRVVPPRAGAAHRAGTRAAVREHWPVSQLHPPFVCAQLEPLD